MIVPNLLVENLQRSVDFYTQALGFETMMVLTADNAMVDDPGSPGAVFATLSWNGFQVMLQTTDHLEASGLDAGNAPTTGLSGSLYLRDFPWDDIVAKLPQGSIVREPIQQWYGMAELAIKDPDGYVWVLGRREGPPPQ